MTRWRVLDAARRCELSRSSPNPRRSTESSNTYGVRKTHADANALRRDAGSPPPAPLRPDSTPIYPYDRRTGVVGLLGCANHRPKTTHQRRIPLSKLARRTGNASAEQLDSPNLAIHTRKEWIEIPSMIESLLVPQGLHRINPRGTARRQVTRSQSNQRNECDDSEKHCRIERLHFKYV